MGSEVPTTATTASTANDETNLVSALTVETQETQTQETQTQAEMQPRTEQERPATAIAALGALTEELVATRGTIANLPTRVEVDKRIQAETRDRKRGQHQLMAMIAMVGIGVGLSAWNVETTKDLAKEARNITTRNQQLSIAHLELVTKIDCVVEAASRLTGEQLQKAYAQCLQVAETTAKAADRGSEKP